MIRTTKRQLKAILLLALLSIGGSAQLSTAAIILTQSNVTPLNGGLVGLTISAVGTEGETINTFTGPTITPVVGSVGVHNVAQAFTEAPTPTTQQHTTGLWNDAWTAYDTYFMYNSAETLSAGPNFSETNNGATTGTLGLPTIAVAPKSGFGTYSAPLTAAKVVLAPNADSNVPFLHVVLRATDWFNLFVRIDGVRQDGTTITVIIPEPTTGALFALAFVGCFGFIRRRAS
jgi:hypothetical protein